MNSRDYYKVTYSRDDNMDSHEILDNETEFNANQFKLYDDFTTDLRISFNPLRNNYNEIRDNRRRGDLNDSGVDVENGNTQVSTSRDSDLLENEVMVDPWSSMDSSNSPLTDSGRSASEDCTPSTSSEPPRVLAASTHLSSDARRISDPKDPKPKSKHVPPKDKARARDLTLDLETLEPDPLRRPHFLDEDYQSTSKSNIECRIPKPHFLDHSPSPDEFDERSDITNPNFLDDEVDGDDGIQKKAGALPKRPQKASSSTYSPHEDRPHRTTYRSTLHYGLESAARSSERDKRASQLYRGTWPGEWTGLETASVRSFSSNGSADCPRSSSNLENKMECVCSLISLLSLSPENNADLSGPLLDMSRSVESCVAMRQAGCIPLLVQLIHSKVARETRDRAAKALRNIIHTQTDDKAGRREARVWRLLEQVREYCYVLENLVEARKEVKDTEDDATKHPSQSVAALMKLSFDEEHRHVVCQLGGLQALAALVSGDQAAHGSGTDDNTCLTMRKYAGMTLTNLTFGDGNNKSLLCSFKDFMLALVEQLESPNDDMRQVTAAVLRNLSWRADTNSKQVLREVGAVKGLTKAAMTCQKEATLKSVLSALWNLTAHCSMNKVALCSVDGALGFLVDMLSYNSPTKTLAIVENAGGIMRNVSSHIAVREDYRQILRERNCLSVLLQHLKSPSLTVVSNSCGTLWNLSARCPQDQQYLWDHGAVPMLRSLIHSKHKMIAMGSGAALKNLLNSKPGKTHIISLDTTARSMNLPALPTLGVRKQKALEQELDQNLAETCDNIEAATSPSTSNREEKNLFTATERQIAMNLERHRMTSSSPLMGALTSQISLSHSAHLASYLSCSNTLLKGALVTRSATGSAGNVNRSDSKDSVTSTHSDTAFDRVARTGKVPVPTPRNKDLMKTENAESFTKQLAKDKFLRYPTQPPVPSPRSTTEMRPNYTESGFDVDQDSCDQPIDFSRKYSDTKEEPEIEKPKPKKKETYGDYQETDLDQPTDYSLRYAEHQSETGSDSEPPGPSIHEDTIKHFATEGTPYETPVIFSTATSMSDLRVICKDKPKTLSTSSVKENPEIMTHSDEKDTCSIEDPPHDNDLAATAPSLPVEKPEKGVFDTKFSSGMISPEKPINYCDEGTPGYFSRVSSLSSLGEPTEEDSLAKRNAMATIAVDPSLSEEQNTSQTKDREGSKAVTFATEAVSITPKEEESRYVEETPLMFSRCSSPDSLPECEHDDQGSIVSEVSRLTSGCISPSDIPDSPGGVSPRTPRRASTGPHTPPEPPHEPNCVGSVFEERVSRFAVEHTPAQFSTATSLSSLTIDEPTQHKEVLPKLARVDPNQEDKSSISIGQPGSLLSNRIPMQPIEQNIMRNECNKEPHPPSDMCKVYFTEDTPAILSKAGSNSNLSALSIEGAEVAECRDTLDTHDTSDSSNLSDPGDLLEECIQKGIAKVVKNKGPTETSPVNAYRDDVYRSLPLYLRSSTETVKMSHEFAKNVHDNVSGSSSGGRSPAPPLPPRPAPAAPPPRPPHYTDGRKHESRLPIKTQRPEKPRTSLPRNDSLSSLSIDSFGSTDREIFEETVQAGLSCVKDDRRSKAHSVERPLERELHKHRRQNKSLDRGDRTNHRSKVSDLEFTKQKKIDRYQRLEEPTHSRYEARLSRSRYVDNGPASLPLEYKRRERSNSLSSLSNDSFGSTDKEVFERIVRAGMQPKTEKPRSKSGDRLDSRDRRKKITRGALDRMVGDEARDRALLEEVIAKGAKRESREKEPGSKNVREPPAEIAVAGGPDRTALTDTGSNSTIESPTLEALENNLDHTTVEPESLSVQSPPHDTLESPIDTIDKLSNPTDLDREINPGQNTQELQSPKCVDSLEIIVTAPKESLDTQTANVNVSETQYTETQSSPRFTENLEKSSLLSIQITLDCTAETSRSNECLAPASANTTIESERDELNRSNESYADVLDASFSDGEQPYNKDTLTRNNKLEWTDIKSTKDPKPDDTSRQDTWNDNTCPDDVTFPTISSSVHLEASRSEALPDLLEQSENRRHSRPDLTSRLEIMTSSLLEKSGADLAEPLKFEDQKLDSIVSAAIEREAARLAAQLKVSTYTLETSATSLTSLDLDNVKPPSDLGSLLSLSASTHYEEPLKKSRRKKSLPVASMVKRALTNSAHHESSEHLDSNYSFLENVKPPTEMENIDMEGSMISVSSIVSEVAEVRDKTPVVFDFKQPIQDFPLCNAFAVFHDLDQINPPSLFDEMAESTLEIESTAQQTVAPNTLYEEASNTLNVVTDIPSGSDCTPLPSDISSVESTPKKQRNPYYLTPKEKRHVSKDRYQTYTITDTVTENDVVLEVQDEFMTWTKTSEPLEYETATSEPKLKRRVSAKQRRLEDRARYQTQTVDIHNIPETSKKLDPAIETLKQRLAAKKTLKQKRLDDAERFRTRTLSEDIPPSPTFVTRDANFENLETTTGYDSLSSNEPSHQHISDENDVFTRDIDSGHNEDDFELNSTQMQTYTKSFRNYLPVIESPAAVDMCVVNNLKNIELTASYRRTLQGDKVQTPSSSDFASYEGDSNSEDKPHSESDTETPRPKPKIVKPIRRDDSLDSNDSLDKEQDAPKVIRGRKKAMYVSPYRRSAPPPKRAIPVAPVTKVPPKTVPAKGPSTSKAQTGAKTKTPMTSKCLSANTSPKKTMPNRSPTKTLKAIAIPAVATKPLPLERQGTFTKDDSSVLAKDLPVPEKKHRFAKPAPVAKPNTSPSRLPQLNRYQRPTTSKTITKSPTKVAKKPEPTMKNSASNHSLQSNDSGKTITIASRSSRQGSTSSVNSGQSSKAKDVESKIASLWKKVEQAKKAPAKADKRVWIESDKTEQPRLIRSSTFEGQPKETKVSTKQKTAIGIRVSQIPSLKPKAVAGAANKPLPSTSGKKPNTRVFARKPGIGQVTT